MTCLPDFLWTDFKFVELANSRPRVHGLVVRMERLRVLWDVSDWSLSVWAVALQVREYLLVRYVAELREKRMMEPDSLILRPCQPATAQEQTATERAPRPRYPSDERRARHSNAVEIPALRSADTPQALRDDSAASPPEAIAEPEITPQAAPPHVYARGLSQAKPSLAEPSQALNAYALEPKPSQAEPSRANGKYRHRREPNSEEMQELLTRHKRADIVEAICRVQKRDKFEGAGNWVRYLTPVLREIEDEKQQVLPPAGIVGMVPGGAGGHSANAPQATPQTPPRRRKPPRFEQPVGGFSTLRDSLPPDLRKATG